MVDGLAALRRQRRRFGKVLDLGGNGGILAASHVVGPEFKRMVTSQKTATRSTRSLAPVFDALSIAPAAVSTKAALDLMGLPGGYRACRMSTAMIRDRDDPRHARSAQSGWGGRFMSSPKLRVLPLGGLGEIGKNMTLIEQDGKSS